MIDELTTVLAPGWLPALGVLTVAVAIDLLLPEPPNRFHPVVWMGNSTSFLERKLRRGGRRTQLLMGLLSTILVASSGTLFALVTASALLWIHPVVFVIGGGLMLRTTFTVRGLRTAALETHRQLQQPDLDLARQSLRNLVSRDPSHLSQPQIVGAALESVAENTTDGYIAPWLFFALAGIPGAFLYRAVNTMDSMVGYRGKFEYYGKSAAILDDLVNLVPARIATVFMLIAGLALGKDFSSGLATAKRDRGLTASPNAGWTMSAMSGLLRVRLEKSGHYVLGSGFADPKSRHILDSISISQLVAVQGVLLTAAILLIIGILV